MQICFYELNGRIEEGIVEAGNKSQLGPTELFAVDYALIKFFWLFLTGEHIFLV